VEQELFDNYGIRKIINVSGTMTALGASPVKGLIIKEMEKILDKWVEIDLLQDKASEVIAEVTEAEAGFVTSSAAAGITLGIAGFMTGKDKGKMKQLPDTNGLNDEVVIQRGHLVNYGANIKQTAELSGCKLIEFGSVSGTDSVEMKGVISERTVAALYVVSHHTTQYGNIQFDEFNKIATRNNIPVIVDAAAEYKFSEYIKKGAELVVCSGHKFLYGPTSGLVAGKEEQVKATRIQNFGIGRGMKVGKEGIVGLIAALRYWKTRNLDNELEDMKEKANIFIERLNIFEKIDVEEVWDPTGNPVKRVQIKIKPEAKFSAKEVTNKLKKNAPPIITRDHHVDEGYFQMDMRFIDIKIAEKICEVLTEIISNL